MPILSEVSTATYTERVFGGLMRALASLLPQGAENAGALAEVLLHNPPVDAAAEHSRSDLNVTGSPLQLLLSARHSHWDTRLIGDPAFYAENSLVRWEKSLAALDALLSLSNAAGLRQAALRSIAQTADAAAGLQASDRPVSAMVYLYPEDFQASHR